MRLAPPTGRFAPATRTFWKLVRGGADFTESGLSFAISSKRKNILDLVCQNGEQILTKVISSELLAVTCNLDE
jgi:hypothetical protein